MAGASIGLERVQTDGKWRGFAGAFAPVGFTLSTPFCSHFHAGARAAASDHGRRG